MGFPGGAVVKNPPANAGDTGSSPGPGRSHKKKKKKSYHYMTNPQPTSFSMVKT